MYESILKFKSYSVNEITFIANDEFLASEEGLQIQFSINKETTTKENNMVVKLITNIFENSKENKYPFEMKIVITGYFTIENNNEEINFEPNAIAILYPYIRSIVSTYTANTNVNALILPIINVNKLIENTKKD